MNDLVTVILPTHKDPGTLYFAIRSVIRQSYPNFELLVVGDGADEDTLRTATLWRE
jgi:glycosyltransferase involved in cell wall biosynthesis